MHFNQELKKEMTEVEQQKICTICFEPIIKAKEAKLDSCTHTYCINCIQRWVSDVENTCPQCKKSVNQLTSKGPDGQMKTQHV